MLDDMRVNDEPLDSSDIRQLENADEIAHFFAKLHYDVDIRRPIPLAQHPAVEQKLHEELDRVLQGDTLLAQKCRSFYSTHDLTCTVRCRQRVYVALYGRVPSGSI